jgi:hypothetical protein
MCSLHGVQRPLSIGGTAVVLVTLATTSVFASSRLQVGPIVGLATLLGDDSHGGGDLLAKTPAMRAAMETRVIETRMLKVVVVIGNVLRTVGCG